MLVTGFPPCTRQRSSGCSTVRRPGAAVRAWSAAIDLCYVATGHGWILGRDLNPWDIAAELLVTEAGGRVTGLGRRSLARPQRSRHNHLIHDAMLDVIRGVE